MSEFIFADRFPENYIRSPEAASVWESWFDALGTSLFDKGNPVFVRAATGDTGQGAGLGGYSLITAENVDGAVELAKNCPIVTSGGGVEVGELTAVPGRHHPARTF